jgi:hypothetical protein
VFRANDRYNDTDDLDNSIAVVASRNEVTDDSTSPHDNISSNDVFLVMIPISESEKFLQVPATSCTVSKRQIKYTDLIPIKRTPHHILCPIRV